jgi:hypothetical protein
VTIGKEPRKCLRSHDLEVDGASSVSLSSLLEEAPRRE